MENAVRRVVWFVIGSLTLHAGLIGFPSGAAAQQKQRPASQAAAPAPAAIASPTEPAGKAANADVRGFRSASFGADEDAVRAAIKKDFQIAPEKIALEENYAEQTRVLSVKVPDLLPGGGTASVNYVLGYKTKALIQVSIAWSKATDETMNAERLFSNGNVLRAHFMAAGYKPESIASNAPVNDGLLLFRGSDIGDRTTLLLLQGTMTQGQNKEQVLSPTTLLLAYVVDARNPDVFKLAPGQF